MKETKISLKEYQKIGVARAVQLLKKNKFFFHRGCMRCGKTIQTLTILSMIAEKRHIITCPAKVICAWEREISRNFPDVRFTTKIKDFEGRNFDVLIVSHDMLHTLEVDKIGALVIDECHKFKCKKTRRSKAAVALAKKAQYKIMCSATVMPNYPKELWSQLNIAGAFDLYQKYRTYDAYTRRFCGWKIEIKNFRGVRTRMINDNGISHPDELNAMLNSMSVVQTRDEIYKEREPVVFHQNVHVLRGIKNSDVVNNLHKLDDITIEQIGCSKDKEIATILEALGICKAKAAVEFILEKLSEADGGNVVVFAHNTSVIDLLKNELSKSCSVYVLSGKTKGSVKDLIADFQSSSGAVLIGQLISASVGIELTSADTVIFVQCSYTPAINCQAIARIDGMNQERDNCFVYYLSSPHATDKRIMQILMEKNMAISNFGEPGAQEFISLVGNNR